MLNCFSDPALLMECSDNRRACPACQFNEYTIDNNGWKTFHCDLGKDQQNGTRTQQNCDSCRMKNGSS